MYKLSYILNACLETIMKTFKDNERKLPIFWKEHKVNFQEDLKVKF